MIENNRGNTKYTDNEKQYNTKQHRIGQSGTNIRNTRHTEEKKGWKEDQETQSMINVVFQIY